MAPKEEDKLLKCGEPVRFGLLTSLFRLESSRLVICSSGLSTSDSALVKTTIGSLSGKKPDFENLCLKMSTGTPEDMLLTNLGVNH